MASASALFDTSVALFVNKDQAAAKQLSRRESDLQNEIEYVQWQLNSFARSCLLSSITFFKEGVLYLFKLRNKGSTAEDPTELAQSGAGIESRQVEVFSSQDLKDLNLTNLDDAGERTLSAAKKDFKQARIEAIKAFNNEALTTSDRIQAMVIRVAATMLENVDHPEDALEVCISCLKELHSLPDVRESFKREILKKGLWKGQRKEIVASVCRINRAIRNAAVLIAKEGELLTLPSIEIGEEKIDLLHDDRVAAVLQKLEMHHISVTALTLGRMDELKIPQGIASNSQGQCIVGDEWDCSVKVFDSNGKYKNTLHGLPKNDEITIVSIVDVATDRDDNMYVLIEMQEKSGAARYKICFFDKQGNMKHEFFLREGNREALRVTVNKYYEVLVLSDSTVKHDKSVLEVYNSDGCFKLSFGEEQLNYAQDICATSASDSNDRVIVLDRDDQCALSLQMFRSNGEYIGVKSLENTKHFTKLRPSMTCDQGGSYVVVAAPNETSRDKKADPVQILQYDMNEDKFRPSIALPIEGIFSTRGIAVTVEGRIAVGLLDKNGGDSRVLVV